MTLVFCIWFIVLIILCWCRIGDLLRSDVAVADLPIIGIFLVAAAWPVLFVFLMVTLIDKKLSEYWGSK